MPRADKLQLKDVDGELKPQLPAPNCGGGEAVGEQYDSEGSILLQGQQVLPSRFPIKMEGRLSCRSRAIAPHVSVTPAPPNACKRKMRSTHVEKALEMGTNPLDPKTSALDTAHKQQRVCSTPVISNVFQQSEPLASVPPAPEERMLISLHGSGAAGPIVVSSQSDAATALVVPSIDHPADWSRQGLISRADAMFNDNGMHAGITPIPSGNCAVQKIVTNELAVEAMLAVESWMNEHKAALPSQRGLKELLLGALVADAIGEKGGLIPDIAMANGKRLLVNAGKAARSNRKRIKAAHDQARKAEKSATPDAAAKQVAAILGALVDAVTFGAQPCSSFKLEAPVSNSRLQYEGPRTAIFTALTPTARPAGRQTNHSLELVREDELAQLRLRVANVEAQTALAQQHSQSEAGATALPLPSVLPHLYPPLTVATVERLQSENDNLTQTLFNLQRYARVLYNGWEDALEAAREWGWRAPCLTDGTWRDPNDGNESQPIPNLYPLYFLGIVGTQELRERIGSHHHVIAEVGMLPSVVSERDGDEYGQHELLRMQGIRML